MGFDPVGNGVYSPRVAPLPIGVEWFERVGNFVAMRSLRSAAVTSFAVAINWLKSRGSFHG